MAKPSFNAIVFFLSGSVGKFRKVTNVNSLIFNLQKHNQLIDHINLYDSKSKLFVKQIRPPR